MCAAAAFFFLLNLSSVCSSSFAHRSHTTHQHHLRRPRQIAAAVSSRHYTINTSTSKVLCFLFFVRPTLNCIKLCTLHARVLLIDATRIAKLATRTSNLCVCVCAIFTRQPNFDAACIAWLIGLLIRVIYSLEHNVQSANGGFIDCVVVGCCC